MVGKGATEKNESPSEYRSYWQKANEFYQTMKLSYREKNWNAVGLNGIHAIISGCDAVLVKSAGKRSSGQSHTASGDLLKKYLPNNPGTPKQVARFKKMVGLKNLIEYERRLFSEKEAADMVLNTDRFMEWAEKIISK